LDDHNSISNKPVHYVLCSEPTNTSLVYMNASTSKPKGWELICTYHSLWGSFNLRAWRNYGTSGC
jgi:hypothetical protein